jgi:lipopolysaccharide transport system ATP-binding protein
MSEFAVRASGLGKRYRLGEAQYFKTLRDVLGSLGKPRIDTDVAKYIWALRDVAFELPEGEALGVIGRNGAGKSTLLKLLSAITAPDEGTVELNGRVGSLLEVGTGFHPELTGRDNIFLNGSILGMRRSEIERKFDQIVAFSGVEEFLDTPVKRYSSGMRVRLGFAVAAHLEPEILVVDEVLAVGDAEFQRRCLGRMHDVARAGRTVLFVSHQMEAIQSLCSRAIWLERGRIVMDGTPGDVVASYLAATLGESQTTDVAGRQDREGAGECRIVRFGIAGPGGRPLMTGAPALIEVGVSSERVLQPSDHLVFNVVIRDHMDRMLTLLTNELTGEILATSGREAAFECEVAKLPLVPGRYSLDVSVWLRGTRQDRVMRAAAFEVLGGDFFGAGKAIHIGSFHVGQTWKSKA